MTLATNSYRSDIDGLRAVAVLSVAIFHLFPAWLPGGFVGVDIFFVISGYLISRIIFLETRQGQFSYLDFYRRRVVRIFPALIFVLAFCLLAGWLILLPDEYQLLGKHIIASSSFVQNLLLLNENGYFTKTSESKPLLHLWSLGVEEQFYIFWPLIIGLGWKFRLRLGWLMIIVSLASFGWSLIGLQANLTEDFYSPLTRFWELAAGALLAWFNVNRSSEPAATGLSQRPQLANAISHIGFVLIAFALLTIDRHKQFPGYWALVPVLGAVAILAAGTQALPNRFFLSERVIVWIGLISYPLYLWHWPLLTYLRILENDTPTRAQRLAVLLASFALAWFTYKFIEKPIRFREKNRHLVSILLVFLIIVIGSLGYKVYLAGGLPNRAVAIENQQLADYLENDANPESPCSIENPSLQHLVTFCKQYAAPTPRKKIILWGDSTVTAWLPVFQTIAKEKNDTLITFTHFSCPPIIGARKTNFTYASSQSYCAKGTIQSDILQVIAEYKPDLIIVLAAWNNYSDVTKREFLTSSASGSATDRSTEQVIKKNLPITLGALSEISNVVVFRSWPMMPKQPNSRAVARLGRDRTEVTISKTDFEKENLTLNSVLNFAANARVSLFDPSQKICINEVCHSELGNTRFYTDMYHIAPQGALRFASEIRELLN